MSLKQNNTSHPKRRLGYLSGAPRVSTRPEAEMSGPRGHVLGVINGFKTLDWDVTPHIVGDRVPLAWISKGSEASVSRHPLRTLVADGVRLGMSYKNRNRAWTELGSQVNWVYERFGSFQAMGEPFRRRGIPWILETNAPVFQESKAERKTIYLAELARRLERKAYHNCDVLVCISQALKDMIVDETGIPQGKVLVIPNGVDTEIFNPKIYTPQRQFSGLTLGFIGGLSAWQGLDLLLQALYELREQLGILINLVVIGEGAMRQEWEALSQTLGMETQVRFLGWLPQPEVPPFTAGFDIGFSGHLDLQGRTVYRSPLKLYEYMSMGKPVITSIVEDSKLLVSQGETGFLFTAGNLESLKLALQKAYEAHERLGEMGDKARAEVVAKHSWVARVRDIIQGTEAILAQKSAAKQQST